jgi:hypothetical protein
MKTKNGEFVLDKHYINFLTGKTKRTRLRARDENGEVSVLTTLIGAVLWAGIVGAILFACLSDIYYASQSFLQYQAFGVRTQAILTECNRKSIRFLYEANGQVLEGMDWVESNCTSSDIGILIPIEYLSNAIEKNQQLRWSNPPEAICVFPIVIILSIFVFFYIRYYVRKGISTYNKFHNLSEKGILLEGIVTKSLFTQYYNRNIIDIPTIHYCFDNPEGKTFHGIRKLRRDDLTEETLPTEGMKVYVLYADDDCHMLL